MQTEFKCPFCNYEKCVAAKMDYDKETGTLECRVCAATYTATINYLSEPVDPFSEWIDQCEAEDEERAKLASWPRRSGLVDTVGWRTRPEGRRAKMTSFCSTSRAETGGSLWKSVGRGGPN